MENCTPPTNIIDEKENTLISKELSERITALRFPMIVLIVLFHCTFASPILMLKHPDLNFAAHTGYIHSLLNTFISRNFLGLLPVFFLISAYLQFSKECSYKKLLVKKAKSLAAPYILWITIAIVIYDIFIAKKLPLIRRSFFNLFTSYVGYYDKNPNERNFGPCVSQLWYVRDLLFLFIFSPILKIIYKKFPVSSFLLVTFFYVADIRPFFVCALALFWYTTGFYLCEYKIDFLKIIDSIKWKSIIPVYILTAYFSFKGTPFSPAYWMNFIPILIIVFKISKPMANNERLFSILKKLSTYSFFLYCIHMPFLNYFSQELWVRLFPMETNLNYFAEFLGSFTITVIAGTGLGFILNFFAKPLFRLLNGSR